MRGVLGWGKLHGIPPNPDSQPISALEMIGDKVSMPTPVGRTHVLAFLEGRSNSDFNFNLKYSQRCGDAILDVRMRGSHCGLCWPDCKRHLAAAMAPRRLVGRPKCSDWAGDHIGSWRCFAMPKLPRGLGFGHGLNAFDPPQKRLQPDF